MTLCESTSVKETEKDDYAAESRDQSAAKCLISRLRYAPHGVKGQAKQASSADQQAIRSDLVKLTQRGWVSAKIIKYL